MTNPRRWARRAILSVLTGGGLTAVGLGTPLGAADASTSVVPPLGPTGTGPATVPVPSPTVVTGPVINQDTQPTPTVPAPSTTTTTKTTAPTAPAAAPTVSGQRKQSITTDRPAGRTTTPTKPKPKPKPKQANKAKKKAAKKTPAGPNSVALPPQLIANQFGVLPSALAGTTVSAQALQYYRIPMFLLPIFQAAAMQYGVPWQVLAAINEVETNYGLDLSVSSAGAVGWMQFMPDTWLQYGVDASNAGFADPFNPADAIFAAARYLRAAGVQSDLRSAIFAYNHSAAYVSSVLLRARLITAYPEAVIATLTGLTEGHAPVPGAHVLAGPAPGAITPAGAGAAPAASSTATAGAVPAVTPTAPSPVAPIVAPAPTRFAELVAAPGSAVVSVQDGRIVQLGHSLALGNYLVLRDVYGDEFTYAGMGSFSARYPMPPVPLVKAPARLARPEAEPVVNPHPAPAGSAGSQPLTLQVRAVAVRQAAVSPAAPPAGQSPTSGKLRLFAHPRGPAATAAGQSSAAVPARARGLRWLPLTRGSVLRAGTVLGHLSTGPGLSTAHLRFAVRPAGDTQTVDPLPILTNWNLLQTALHPQGARAGANLLGATAGSVFLLSKSELERAVLGDPGISIYSCGRRDIASGAIDDRVLAVLAFLSRSGLKPTVSALRCGHSVVTTTGSPSAHAAGLALTISAINGIPVANHQGPGTVTDATIRALLSLQGRYVPRNIISLMSYPGTSNTLALPDHWDQIHVGFGPESSAQPLKPAAAAAAGHGRAARLPAATALPLDPSEWDQLIATVAAIPTPRVTTAPSTAAIRDPQAAPGNQNLGTLPTSGF